MAEKRATARQQRKKHAGYKIDKKDPQGKWVKIGDYKDHYIGQVKNEGAADGEYRLRNSRLTYTYFMLPPGRTAVISGLSYRVLEEDEVVQEVPADVALGPEQEVA